MIERADQLVLEYVSKVADAAHGVLRQDQRLDFIRRLRERIDAERRGLESPAAVRKVLAVFGDPEALVAREVRRLQEARAPKEEDSPTLMAAAEAVTRELPPVRSKPPRTSPASPASPASSVGPASSAGPGTGRLPRGMPPGVARFTEEARRKLAEREAGGRRPDPGERGPEGTGVRGVRRGRRSLRRGRDARGGGRAFGAGEDGREDFGAGESRRGRSGTGSIPAARPREVAGIAVLVLAALLVPVPLAPVAIFPIPFLVWAVGTAVVLSCSGWEVGDKVLSAAAPVLVYAIGGAAVAIARAEGDLDRMISGFHDVSGSMFVLGTAVGALWLAYRLVNPPAPFTGRP
ncbi:hypothetical protein GCM10010156_34740 [Planobispora rosea]|uniref:Uncharacterized protein n=1 Tax=Planobispora rosea TaxID=35762 RepID=A0A8J3WDN7_PLARO|nr:hypothetical protein [Planobispora rosea]GGS72879.1 hypothetical protein GCM10010156_34740 [Planobispora rosea]GIH85338.1 hypothetical protein Pro02_37460 [Planobispora rosea]